LIDSVKVKKKKEGFLVCRFVLLFTAILERYWLHCRLCHLVHLLSYRQLRRLQSRQRRLHLLVRLRRLLRYRQLRLLVIHLGS
jgi:hypothetical protein